MLTSFHSSTSKLNHDASGFNHRITPREQEVLHLIAHEHSSKEIARKLYVSYETINSHRKNIMTKLEVSNTAGMVRAAFENGILSVGQVAFILLFFCSISVNAQVTNGDKINYEIETDQDSWYVPSNDCCEIPWRSEMVCKFYALDDSDCVYTVTCHTKEKMKNKRTKTDDHMKMWLQPTIINDSFFV